ncbi:MAG: restriction endonuclease [Bacteroidales bacterium]|nr:restriction endonuclease [Bacteroidales bacterium]
MAYTSINIQGNIISSEILDRIRQEEPAYRQKPVDFGLDRNQTVRDEINIAWAATKSHWEAFQIRRERIPEEESGTTETRQSWMIPFFFELGYELEVKRQAEVINDKTYFISHKAHNHGEFPVHIVGINQSLDKRAETGGTRLSPHALVQEYLNNHEHLFALVTNGRFLRLLRDATRLSRLSYLEFDLQRMMDDNLFNEFALMYRLLHVTRMPVNVEEGENSIIEFYHQESLASGTRIREKLSEAVERAITGLGNGFLVHPANDSLRDAFREQQVTADKYYLYLLRLIYRLLFLMVVEERNLIYPDERNPRLDHFRNLYLRHYSLKRLRELALKSLYVDSRHHDLWEGLKVTFRLFEEEKYGRSMGISPLGSGLFDPDALGILADVKLDNEIFLMVLRILTTFESEQKQLVKVNYGDLDVEEFGSVYEGLLEYDPQVNEAGGKFTFSFVTGQERSKSGTHYTPEELVKPLIQHSLDYLIEDCIKKPHERLKMGGGMQEAGSGKQVANGELRLLQEKALLSLKVADVACGSGHILLSAARRIGLELARVRTSEDQPTPPAIRRATRDVICSCIYGVDINPLAVELCKVAMWLEAHNPGQPLNFLDHRIKCGDAIVGLAHFKELENGIADEAFKALPGDDKKIAALFRRRNAQERKLAHLQPYDVDNVDKNLNDITIEYTQVINMPERTPKEIEIKRNAYQKLLSGPRWMRLKQLADMQVAQFFISKIDENINKIITHAEYGSYLKTSTQILGHGPAKATAMAAEKRFFHYFLEFPEVFRQEGFDCVLGNPPYLGAQKITENFSEIYHEYIRHIFNTKGITDLAAYFLLRIHDCTLREGFISLITTNSISQGDTRESGLAKIIRKGSYISFANKNIRWPGQANTIVTIFGISKNRNVERLELNGSYVENINSYLYDIDNELNKKTLKQNIGIGFVGSYLYGDGFIIDDEQAMKWKAKYPNIIKKYINGDDLNNHPMFQPSRWVIDFADMDNEEAKKFTEPFNYIEKFVFPVREKVKRKQYKDKWWMYAERRVNLYKSIQNNSRVLVRTQASKHNVFEFIDNGFVFDQKLIVFKFQDYYSYAILNSNIHESWILIFCGDFGGILNYSPTDIFETFPFPQKTIETKSNLISDVAQKYQKHRVQILIQIQLGLTRTYNLFHSKEIRQTCKSENTLDDTSFEKLVGKEALQLRKHLAKTPGTISFNEAIESIIKLRELHVQMDEAVLEAYGWHEDSPKWGPAIQLRHDFYEVDYLPENDRIRFTIHPDARKEVLKRLLKLNYEIHEEEVRAGLWEKKGGKEERHKGAKAQRHKGSDEQRNRGFLNEELPLAAEEESGYRQGDLFAEEPRIVQVPKPATPKSKKVKEFITVTIRRDDGREFHYHITPFAKKDHFSGKYKQILPDSNLAQAMIGKMEGQSFEFGGSKFEVEEVGT